MNNLTLLFHYVYYVTRKSDIHRGRSASFSKARTVFVIGLTETLILITAYLIISRVVVGHLLARPPLPYSISPAVVSFAVALVLCYLNVLVIDGASRADHYKKIFDGWSSGKRLRWKILLIGIAIASLAAFFLVGEISQNGFDPHDWKY